MKFRTKLLRVMKITTLLLLIGALHVSAGAGAQKVSLRAKDMPLEEAIVKIKQQTGLFFIYNDKDMAKTKPITINLKNEPLAVVLDSVFRGQPLTYELQGNTVFIVVRKEQQEKIEDSPPIDIHGRVVDSTGRPVAGATVIVKGSKAGVATNANGEFVLKNVKGNETITISSVGFERQEVKLEGKTEFAIQLRTKASELKNVEVVYSNGYQKIAPERATGSYAHISNQLYDREVSTDVLSRLDGITNALLFDNRPGSASPLQVRGISSISSTTNPLIVLDDFPYTGDINNINPNDIESVTVLKDAAAASIWGAQAGNGVIVLTTKKAKYNQAFHLSFSSNESVTEKPRLFTEPLMSTSDFINVEQFLFGQGFYDAALNSPYRTLVSPVVEILNSEQNGTISPADALAQINVLRGDDTRNDLNKYVNRNTVNGQYHINISGGTAKLLYNLSAGYDHGQAGIIGSGSDRYTIHSITDFKPVRGLEVHTGIYFVENDASNHGTVALPGYPYAKLADANGIPLVVGNSYRPGFVDTAGNGQLLDWTYRPLEELRNGYTTNTTRSQYLMMNIGANLEINKWLSTEVKYQYTRQLGVTRNLYGQQSFYTRNLINLYSQINGNTVNRVIPLGDILEITNNELASYNLRGQLNINKNWKGKHQLTGLIGGEVSNAETQSNNSGFYGYNQENLAAATNVDYANIYPIYDNLSYSTHVPNANGGFSDLVNRTASFLANASYSYLNKYILYTSGREDGSNIFGVKTNNKWKPLWSAGAAWVISREDFYHIGWLPDLKLRASYGYMGNTNNTQPALATISTGGYSYFTNLPFDVVRTPANPSLSWEQVGEWNLGLDLSGLKGRVAGSIEVYRKRSKDLIAPVSIDPTSGFTQAFVNAASLRGNGLDIQLATKNITGVVSWETSFLFNYAKTVVTNYYNSYYASTLFVGNSANVNPLVGRSVFGLFSYKWAGLDPATGDPQGYLDGKVSKDYLSIAQDSIQNQAFSGSTVPLYFGSIMNTVRWKGFSLSANITYRLDYYFRRPTISYSSLFSVSYGATNGTDNSDYEKRWQKPGDEKITTVPSMVYPADTYRDGFYVNSLATVERGDNIRLHDLRVSYTWENKLAKGMPLRSAELFVTGSNLAVIWKATRSGLDPDSPTIKPSRGLAMGLRANF